MCVKFVVTSPNLFFRDESDSSDTEVDIFKSSFKDSEDNKVVNGISISKYGKYSLCKWEAVSSNFTFV